MNGLMHSMISVSGGTPINFGNIWISLEVC